MRTNCDYRYYFRFTIILNWCYLNQIEIQNDKILSKPHLPTSVRIFVPVDCFSAISIPNAFRFASLFNNRHLFRHISFNTFHGFPLFVNKMGITSNTPCHIADIFPSCGVFNRRRTIFFQLAENRYSIIHTC